MRISAPVFFFVEGGDFVECSMAIRPETCWSANQEDSQTETHPLLCGTRRASLLAQGVLAERDIPATEVGRYQKMRLFNAMIPFGEVELPCAAVSYHSTNS